MIIENLTPRILRTPRGNSIQLRIPPLARLDLTYEQEVKLNDWIDQEQSANRLAVIPEADNNNSNGVLGDRADAIPGMLAVLTVVVFVLIAVSQSIAEQIGVALATTAMALIVLLFLSGALIYLLRGQTHTQQRRAFVQGLSLSITTVYPAIFPVLIILFFAGGKELLPGGSSEEFFTRALSDREIWLSRLLLLSVLAMIYALALFPVLLFFLFDRQRLVNVLDNFYRDMFQLDPDISNIRELHSKYGAKIDEAFGEIDRSSRTRIRSGTRIPVLLAVVVFTAGWTLSLVPPLSNEPLATLADVLVRLAPAPEPTVFAFLGAYFFSIYLVFRRYSRRDLHPKTYTQIVWRVVVAIVVAWLLDAVLADEVSLGGQEIAGNKAALMLAFTAGIFPENVVLFIQKSVIGDRGLPLIGGSDNTLSGVREIDLYDRARLLDEGISSVEALAHCDLVGLMIDTRVPVAQLVDWVDQAILRIHLIGTPAGEQLLTNLAESSIYRASDVLRAYYEARQRSEDEAARLFWSFEERGRAEGRTPRVQVVVDTIQRDPWMHEILHFRRSGELQPVRVKR